jgi:hypothetical protein
MLTRIISMASVGLMLTASVAKADFLPENDLWQEDGFRLAGGLSQDQFNAVIDETVAVYASIFQAFGATLTVNRLWTNGTVNARAFQTGTNWQVNMYGGLARRPEVTRDGFQLVLCHEIGHHLGGYPFTASWAANEGQSDYFATLACGRILWQGQDEINATFAADVEAIPKAQCDVAWDTTEDQNLCYRLMAGGKSMADLLSTLDGVIPSWSTPDKSVVTSTYHAHPNSQCRLDTYAAGAMCGKDWDVKIIPAKDLGSQQNSDAGEQASLKYTCNQSEGLTLGFRPTCWFKPFLTATTAFE